MFLVKPTEPINANGFVVYELLETSGYMHIALKGQAMSEHNNNLRDLAAMFAMNGLIAREGSGAFDFAVHPQDPWRVAQWAYDVADQMMRVRENKECEIPPLPENFGIAALKPRRKKAA